MANERFVKLYSEGNSFTSVHFEVFLDRATGVNYVFCKDGSTGGLTPLLDKDGKPIVTPFDNK